MKGSQKLELSKDNLDKKLFLLIEKTLLKIGMILDIGSSL
jgi:hypothetical protein